MALLKASPVQFKLATLHIPTPVTATWFIYWYNFNPNSGKLERVKKTFNLNRIDDTTQRQKHANECITVINKSLRNGWNYFTVSETVAKQEKKAVAEQEKKSLVSALYQALRIRQLGTKPRTASSYKSFVTVFCEWLEKNNYSALPVADMTRDLFMEYLFDRSEQGNGNGNLNRTISFFRTTFNVIIKDLKLIDDNPIDGVDDLPEHGSSLFQPLTMSEIRVIVPALIAHNPRFYLFTKFIPHEFIRPHHIARLKAGDIDYERSLIMLNHETRKNNSTIQKELLPGMKAILLEMKCHELPGNYYLFGKNFEPSATLYPSLSIRAAELWKSIVIDGMGIDKKMYALKHTSSQYLVNENNNFDLKFLQQHMEHHSFAMTEIYLQNKIVKKIDKKANILDY